MQQQNLRQCAQRLLKLNKTIVFVESASAGRLCSEFALQEGASTFLRGGIVCYQEKVKKQLLQVPESLLQRFTAESAEVTAVLARHALSLLHTDLSLAVTGLLAPGGSEGPEKPVGTIFVHLCSADRELAHREWFPGKPEEILQQLRDRVAGLLLQFLEPFPEIV